MLCRNCGSEWKAGGSYSQIDKCPFCGKSLTVNVSNAITLDSVLKFIFLQFGEELLLDESKFISVFSDLAPKMKIEKKILTVALNQDIAKNFVNTPITERGQC